MKKEKNNEETLHSNKAAMNEKSKKSALDDSASIYEKRQDEPVKNTWSELDKRGKWEFFKDYYLLKIVVGVIAIAFVSGFVIKVFGPHTNQILYVAVLGDRLKSEQVTEVTDDLSTMMDTDKYHEILFDDAFDFSEEGSTFSVNDKITTMLYADVIDVMIVNNQRFKEFSYYGNYKNLDTYLPDDVKEALGDKLLTANVEIERDGDSDLSELDSEDENAYADGEPFILGIDLSDCPKYKALSTYEEQPILTVSINSPNEENTIKFIRYLFDLPEA